MRYPVLARSKTESLARLLARGDHMPNWELERDWVGSGQEVDLSGLDTTMREFREAYDRRESKSPQSTPEAFEGRYSGAVHMALRDLPIEALDDPGFWRYLSLVDFWWFVAVREAPAIGRGNVMTYVDGGKECVPFRMFLRGQAIRDEDDYHLAGGLPKAADFWRSHILRVKTGTAPPLSRAFVRLQTDKGMVSDEVRPFARRLNRLWTNVVFHTWTEDECLDLLTGLYDEMYGEGSQNAAGSSEA
jgi:hypothetical protein